MNPHRLLVDQVLAWIHDEIDGADTWKVRRTEPRAFDKGTNLAMWWTAGERNDADSTTAWLGIREAFVIRYWEPAEEQRLAADEKADEALGDKLHAFRQMLMRHTDLPAGNLMSASVMEWLGDRLLGPADNALTERGFEIVISVRRAENYT